MTCVPLGYFSPKIISIGFVFWKHHHSQGSYDESELLGSTFCYKSACPYSAFLLSQRVCKALKVMYVPNVFYYSVFLLQDSSTNKTFIISLLCQLQRGLFLLWILSPRNQLSFSNELFFGPTPLLINKMSLHISMPASEVSSGLEKQMWGVHWLSLHCSPSPMPGPISNDSLCPGNMMFMHPCSKWGNIFHRASDSSLFTNRFLFVLFCFSI